MARGAAELGLAAQTGVARNRFVALCAARTQPGVTHVYPGQEAGFLEVQDLEILPLSESERRTLERWGVRMVGELARLGERELTERFGARGAWMARWARGESSGVLQAWQAPPQLEVSRDLDWELGELEPLAFVLSGMLETLCLRLQSHNLAAARLHTGLKLARGGLFERPGVSAAVERSANAAGAGAHRSGGASAGGCHRGRAIERDSRPASAAAILAVHPRLAGAGEAGGDIGAADGSDRRGESGRSGGGGCLAARGGGRG